MDDVLLPNRSLTVGIWDDVIFVHHAIEQRINAEVFARVWATPAEVFGDARFANDASIRLEVNAVSTGRSGDRRSGKISIRKLAEHG